MDDVGVRDHVDQSDGAGGEGFLERGHEVFGVAHGVTSYTPAFRTAYIMRGFEKGVGR